MVSIYLPGGPVWEPNVSVRITPVLRDRTHHLVVEPSGPIERSNDRDNRGVVRKLGSEGFDDGVRTSNSTTLRMPPWVTNPMTRVVETVLASRGSVQVDDDLQPVCTSPFYSLVEVRKLTLNIRLA